MLGLVGTCLGIFILGRYMPNYEGPQNILHIYRYVEFCDASLQFQRDKYI